MALHQLGILIMSVIAVITSIIRVVLNTAQVRVVRQVKLLAIAWTMRVWLPLEDLLRPLTNTPRRNVGLLSPWALHQQRKVSHSLLSSALIGYVIDQTVNDGFPQRRPGFNPRSNYVAFVVIKWQSTTGSLTNLYSTNCSISFIIWGWYNRK
jgi:hypothetical protein